MWWHVRTQFEQGKIAMTPDDELVRELTGLRQSKKNGVIRVESRREYYERTGGEPNKAIAFAVGLWAQHGTLPMCSACKSTKQPLAAIWDDDADKALLLCQKCLPATLRRLGGEQ